jgi:hypothetical protein
MQVSGVNLSSFWIAHFIWDSLMYSILALMKMVVVTANGADAAQVCVGDTASLFFIATFSIPSFGVSFLPFDYRYSRMFDNHSSAQVVELFGQDSSIFDQDVACQSFSTVF